MVIEDDEKWYEPSFLDIETGFLYVKIIYEGKINVYNLRKNGKKFSYLSAKCDVRADNTTYLIRLINEHGLDI